MLNCADETAAEIDKEIMELLKKSYEGARVLLMENRSVLDQLAEFLIEKETITGKEFMKIFFRQDNGSQPIPGRSGRIFRTCRTA